MGSYREDSEPGLLLESEPNSLLGTESTFQGTLLFFSSCCLTLLAPRASFFNPGLVKMDPDVHKLLLLLILQLSLFTTLECICSDYERILV